MKSEIDLLAPPAGLAAAKGGATTGAVVAIAINSEQDYQS